MSLIYKKIKNNTNNSIIVNGTYIGPLSETVMSSDAVDLIDQQYFTAGILIDLGETNIDNGTLVIDTQTIQFYKKPASGIPKNHLDSEVRGSLDKATKSLQKGQVSLEDLNVTLQNIIKSGATDVNGDGIVDKSPNTIANTNYGYNSVVIKENQLDKPIREALQSVRDIDQKFKDGINFDNLASEVTDSITHNLSSFENPSWKEPVDEILPLDGNKHGDVRLLLSSMTLWAWNENENDWKDIVGTSIVSPEPDKGTIGKNPLIAKTVVCEFFADEGQTVFTIEHSYDVGTNQLEVCLNGILATKNVDYEEVDKNTIQFYEPLHEDDYVLASINAGYSGAVHNVENIIVKEDSDKRVIRSTYVFEPNGNALRVFLNGIMVECGENGDYIEVDQNHIKFNYDLVEEDRITLRVGSSNVSENILNQFATFRKIYSTLSKQVDVLQDKVDKMTKTN